MPFHARLRPVLCAVSLALAACSSSGSSDPAPAPAATGTGDSGATTPPPPSDDEERQRAVQGMHDALLEDVTTLAKAAEEIEAAAPTPADRGWDATLDAAAIGSMRATWMRARTAYEHVEGALAPLFPDIDYAIDARYDDFMGNLAASGGDAYLFDGVGVTGMHAIERILFADTIPQRVVDFEKTLPGYVPAAMPRTAQEAADFKAKLCARLVADTKTLLEQWTPAKIDVAVAYQGLVSLVKEQLEKVQKAATSEEESRYSQRTMTDLRDNLAGSRKAYGIFQPWILTKGDDGKRDDERVLAGFAALDAAYGAVTGEAIPAPPPTWSAEQPSAADLATPFGKLYSAVHTAVDPANQDSVVVHLVDAGKLLGFAPQP